MKPNRPLRFLPHPLSCLFTVLVLGLLCLAAAPAHSLDAFKVQTDVPVQGWQLLGPVYRQSELSAADSLRGFFGSDDPAKAWSEKKIWIENRPFSWFSAPEEYADMLRFREIFGPEKFQAPQNLGIASSEQSLPCVYAYCRLDSDSDEPLAMVVSSHGPVRIWLNEKQIGPDAESDRWWSRPGADRYVCMVTLKKGENHLLVESTPPLYRAPWDFSLRFASRDSFARGKVDYPQWEYDRAPAWSPKSPPKWMRLGNPDVENFLKDGDRPCTFTCRDAMPDDKVVRVHGQVGEKIDFKKLAPELSPRDSMAQFWLTADYSDLSETESRHLRTKREWLLLGDPSDTPIAIKGEDKVFSQRYVAQESPDFQRIFADLSDFSPIPADSRGEGLLILRHSLSYLENNTGGRKLPERLWRRLSTPRPGNEHERLSYNFILPEDFSESTRGLSLAVVFPPVCADSFYPILQYPQLEKAALENDWILLVPDIQTPSLSGCGDRLMSMRDYHAGLEAILSDLEKRLDKRARHITFIGMGLGASRALAHRLYTSRQIDFFVCWDLSEAHAQNLASHFSQKEVSGPYYVFASAESRAIEKFPPLQLTKALGKDKWKALIHPPQKSQQDFQEIFTDLSAAPSAVDSISFTAESPNQARQGWLYVSRAYDWGEPVHVMAKVANYRQLRVLVKNVQRLEIELSQIPGLQKAKPLEIYVNDDVVHILGRSLPDSIALQMLQTDDDDFWAIEEVSKEEDDYSPMIQVARVSRDIYPWSTTNQGGIFKIQAAAAREYGGADVGLVLSDTPATGLPAGPLYLRDLSSWLLQTELVYVSVEADKLMQVVQADLEGRGLFVIDGFSMQMHNGINGLDFPPDTKAGKAQMQEHRNRPPARLIASGLPDGEELVKIAGPEDAITYFVSKCQELSKKPEEELALERLGAKHMKAAIEYLRHHPSLEIAPMEFRLMPHKKAEDTKTSQGSGS